MTTSSTFPLLQGLLFSLVSFHSTANNFISNSGVESPHRSVPRHQTHPRTQAAVEQCGISSISDQSSDLNSPSSFLAVAESLGSEDSQHSRRNSDDEDAEVLSVDMAIVPPSSLGPADNANFTNKPGGEARQRRNSASTPCQALTLDPPLRYNATWYPPEYIEAMQPKHQATTRQHFDIKVRGEDVHPPAASFADLKIPLEIQDYFRRLGVLDPSPIQMQGLPCALAGRNVVASAPTGSGKSFFLLLPLLSTAYNALAERGPPRHGTHDNRGTYGLLVAPTRELAYQLLDEFQRLAECVASARGVRVDANALVGSETDHHGQPPRQVRSVVVGTLVRVLSAVRDGVLSLSELRITCIDEVHRLYCSDGQPPSPQLQELLSLVKPPVQRVLCSSTLPSAVERFACHYLRNPVVVRVGPRHGVSEDVTEETHIVPRRKWLSLLVQEAGVLFKTPPPVLVFCAERGHVEDTHRFLVHKGFRSRALHSKLGGVDKHRAAEALRCGDADVLVATDIASAGLHFPGLNHVVCLGRDRERWRHTHRIGRVGRGGRLGLATTVVEGKIEWEDSDSVSSR